MIPFDTPPPARPAPAPDALPFLLRDYELRLNYLSAHFTRMWTRFNFFLTLESALSAAFWIWIKEASGAQTKASPASLAGIAWVGLVSSVVWYLFGAQDRYLVAAYREEAKQVGEQVAARYGVANYSYVGNPESEVKMNLSQWRSDWVSVTRLAALFPLLVVAYWLAMILLGYHRT